MALGGAAHARPVSADRVGLATGLHDARYCEILELKGAPPDARVLVWNTIKLGMCPAAWWSALDAGSLATELGDTLVVLNGPRHFLMDAADATAGPVRGFHGQRLTRVASLPIRTAADLEQTPYHDRTVHRTNTWRWKRGRTVFELVAPGGDTYVMQSYAQIVDPALTLADLPSLGSRLSLPAGWRYRSRRLSRPLTLRAHGSATILLDDLKDTYQLASTTRPKRPRMQHAGVVTVDGKATY